MKTHCAILEQPRPKHIHHYRVIIQAEDEKEEQEQHQKSSNVYSAFDACNATLHACY